MLLPIALVILFVLLYFKLYRPWQLRWGATEEEIKQSMVGDEIVSNPTFNANRAITIHAKAEHIYPWIIQMGNKRAGWYSYDWIDNLGKKSLEHIDAKLQKIEEGQLIPMSPNGKVGLFVKSFETNNWVLWWDQKGRTTWLWKLNRIDENNTRLITRVRIQYRWFSPEMIFNLFLDAGDFFMMKKCMLGIKKRTEKLSQF